MAKEYGTPGERTLSPDLCTSRKLARCSIGAQALYDRVILQSDDQGRQAGDPSLVKLACFPICAAATISKVAAWLSELAEVGLVLWYEAEDDARVIQVVQWWRYQASQRRAYPSRWQAPSGHEDTVYGLHADERPGTIARKMAGHFPPVAGQTRPVADNPPPISAPAVAVAVAGAVAGAVASMSAGADPPARKAPKKPATGPPAEAIAGWETRFLAARGKPYAFNGGKDGRHVKELLKRAQGDVGEVLRRADALFADPFFADKGIDLGTLQSQWNKLAGGSGRAPPTHDIRVGQAPPTPHEGFTHTGRVPL